MCFFEILAICCVFALNEERASHSPLFRGQGQGWGPFFYPLGAAAEVPQSMLDLRKKVFSNQPPAGPPPLPYPNPNTKRLSESAAQTVY